MSADCKKVSGQIFSLDEMVEIVFTFAVTHKRSANTKKAKMNIELWVKANLYERQLKNTQPFKQLKP